MDRILEQARSIAQQARDRQRANPTRMSVAIRTKCLDCSGWQMAEVRECVVVACPLWPFRMGRRATDADLAKHFGKVQETPLV